MKYLKLFEDVETPNSIQGHDLLVEVSFGTDFIKEVDETLNKLKSHGLVRRFNKEESVDSFKYIIDFTNAEGAFLFGKTRPQMKI